MTNAYPSRPTTVRAAWVVPVDGPPIERGAVRIEQGRIVAVESASHDLGSDALDVGEAIILPGLINAHTHLELSYLAGRCPYTGDFAAWLGSVTAGRPKTRAQVADAVQAGADASVAAGVTCVGDICYENLAWPTLKAHPIRAVAFAECIGIGQRRHDAVARLTEQMHGMTEDDRFWIGISPHAPYSVAPEVYRQCLHLARANGWPITTHLAETPDEASFVRDGAGPYLDFLQAMGVVDQSIRGYGVGPVAYAGQLGLLAHPTLLAHVNYIDDSELGLLAGGAASVAYCPGSHEFFRHRTHRFPEMLGMGVNVCVGTDSLASSESLSVLDELRLIRRRHPDLPGSTLLAMGTIHGARGLGQDESIGSLSIGKCADLVVLPMDPGGPDDPIENVLCGHTEPLMVLIGGEVACHR